MLSLCQSACMCVCFRAGSVYCKFLPVSSVSVLSMGDLRWVSVSRLVRWSPSSESLGWCWRPNVFCAPAPPGLPSLPRCTWASGREAVWGRSKVTWCVSWACSYSGAAPCARASSSRCARVSNWLLIGSILSHWRLTRSQHHNSHMHPAATHWEHLHLAHRHPAICCVALESHCTIAITLGIISFHSVDKDASYFISYFISI